MEINLRDRMMGLYKRISNPLIHAQKGQREDLASINAVITKEDAEEFIARFEGVIKKYTSSPMNAVITKEHIDKLTREFRQRLEELFEKQKMESH